MQLIHDSLESTTLTTYMVRWIRPPVTATSRGDLQLTHYSFTMSARCCHPHCPNSCSLSL